MLSRKMRDAYEKGVLVRIKLYENNSPVYGWVIGGQRSHSGEHTSFLTSDGFYSYTIKEVSGEQEINANLKPEHTPTVTRTILAGDIKEVEYV